MSNDEFLCARCARHQKTCCTFDIYVTLGDIDRIESFTGQEDFYEFRAPENSHYLDQDDDPTWRDGVFREDGSRRVLKHTEVGCTFLGEHGCSLPLETRPLICRLYPFDYTEEGIAEELAVGCPLELLKPGQGLIEALDMKLADAQRWQKQLYTEIRHELAEKQLS